MEMLAQFDGHCDEKLERPEMDGICSQRLLRFSFWVTHRAYRMDR